MHIRAFLLKEKIYLKSHANAVTEYACLSPEHFAELMACFLDKEYRVAQRAAWSVSDAVAGRPQLIDPYLQDIVAQLKRTDVHNAVIRNSVRILEKLTIPEALHGEVMNACFHLIETAGTPVAIKAFALTTLYNLSKMYPEIKNELQLIIEENMDKETAAFRNRGQKILRWLQEGKAPGI